MSLLSDFGDFSNGASLNINVQTLRAVAVFATTADSNSGGYTTSPDIKQGNNIQYFVQYADGAVTESTGNVSIIKYNKPSKRIEHIQGPSRGFVSGNSRVIVMNPFISNGNGWLIVNPGIASTGSATYTTTDNGSTYNIPTGFAVNNITSAANSYFSGGGWFDGTTFAVISSNTNLGSTTDGINWVNNGASYGVSPWFPGNNVSAYSGYWFARLTGGNSYSYRTGPTATPTTVSSYRLLAMSPGGRYMQRWNTSSYSHEYSNDGGSSWTSFPSKITSYLPYGCFCTDDGGFFATGYYGNVYCFSFSLNKWILVAVINGLSNVVTNIQVFKVDGVETLFFNAGGEYRNFLADCPKAIA